MSLYESGPLPGRRHAMAVDITHSLPGAVPREKSPGGLHVPHAPVSSEAQPCRNGVPRQLRDVLDN